MPVKNCKVKKVKGKKWGKNGFCYTGKNAKNKARKQGVAIILNRKA